MAVEPTFHISVVRSKSHIAGKLKLSIIKTMSVSAKKLRTASSSWSKGLKERRQATEQATLAEPRSSRQATTVKFGSVTLTGGRLPPGEVQLKLKQGQRAFAKAASTLTKPGVRLNHADDVPIFHADPKDPRRIIRVLNGKAEVGRFVGAVFKPL